MEGEGEGRIREEGGRQWERGGKRASGGWAGCGERWSFLFLFCFAFLVLLLFGPKQTRDQKIA